MSYFTLQFTGANPHPQVTGIDELPGKSNYFLGSNPKSWHTQIPQFSKVRYANLYPGIDLIFYSRDGRLEYDLVAAPGADLSRVHIKTTNARATLLPTGDVALDALHAHSAAANAPVLLKRPYAYQPADDSATAGRVATVTANRPAIVLATYALRGDDLSFALPAYDRSRTLVIDPALIFSTYISNNCANCGGGVSDMAVDSTGIYLTGATDAPSFPALSGQPPSQTTFSDNTFTFIKLNLSGTQLIYSTLLSDSDGASIAVDSSHDTYVSGIVNVPHHGYGPFTFPLTSGVFSGTVPNNSGPATIAYAAKLDGTGILTYSTLLQQYGGGVPATWFPQKLLWTPREISMLPANLILYPGASALEVRAYVTQGAFQTTPGNLWALKLNATASGMDYATYIDGLLLLKHGEAATGIASRFGGRCLSNRNGGTGFPTTTGVFTRPQPTRAVT